MMRKTDQMMIDRGFSDNTFTVGPGEVLHTPPFLIDVRSPAAYWAMRKRLARPVDIPFCWTHPDAIAGMISEDV